ncbi:MAG TPA: GlsB/YeaQ/YmgE family stress response membrane protein [Ktedonobacteraceae bacterium]|nr:GlsB/YeaQ/YmgE family stress response membrane protein [Ktedonobacteraceae bacterium]
MTITLPHLLVWLLIALIAGFLGELIARRRAPAGIIGATVIGFIAIFLIVGVLGLHIAGDPLVAGVPFFTSVIVAAILVAIWSSFAYRRVYRPSYERYYRRRGGYVRRPRRRRGLF